MNRKITAIGIVTMILLMTFPATSTSISNISNNTTKTYNSHLQKINPYLKEEMERNNTSTDQLLRVLIRYNQKMTLELPAGIKILRKFEIIPLISALATPYQIKELAKIDSIEYIYPDLEVHALNLDRQQWGYPNKPMINDLQNAQLATESIPNTPWLGNYPCFLNESTALIGADNLWANGITGEGTIIAILDTGINKYHPDLDDMDDDPATCDPKVIGEAVFIEEPWWEVGDPKDYYGHGTHCASIAAGTGATGAMGFYGTYFGERFFNNTILPGTERGVAPGAYLYNVKVLNNYGSGYDSWIIAGIEWAMEHGADVISMSLGGWPITPPEEDPMVLALNTAIEHGVVCVIAAGNSGWGYFTMTSPGFGPAAITVGATTETDELAIFSSRGPEQYELHAKPDIAAPGDCVVAAFALFDEVEWWYGQQVFYLEASGTSMATPHVAGAAALLLEAFPGATPYTVKSAMMLGADDLGLDTMAQGAGRLNVTNAYELMDNASKKNWAAPVATNTVTPKQPIPMFTPNLTYVDILIEESLCDSSKISTFISKLSLAGANITHHYGPISNSSLVDPVTEQPFYDVFILSEPYTVYELWLPPSVLAYYVQQNGTVLFTGDMPLVCTDYDTWTGQWGINWNNKAVGGLSTNIASHAITTGIQEIYFSSPIASLILNASVTPTPECVVWDPILPGVAVWEAQAPSTGKVVVLSDDGILTDHYLYAADNLEFGFNIIKWFTNTPDMIDCSIKGRLTPPIESPHPYPSSADLWYPVYAPGADWVSVHFETIDVESGWDYIYIYDQFMNPMQTFTGYYEDYWSVPVPGDMLWIRLYSDSIIQYWGFLADSYMYGTTAPSLFHEIGVGGTWEKYVIANSTFTMTVDVHNFGNYTEDVALYMTLYNMTGDLIIDGENFKNVTLAPGETTTVEVSPEVILNATTKCDFAGTHNYDFIISGDIYNSSSGSPPYLELDYTNNAFNGEIASVPKTDRSGLNPLLGIITPMKIESTSAPLITMYPNDFTLHNITAFVGGGELVNAEFRITGTVTTIADFVNVTTFTKHYGAPTYYGWLPDPTPAYFIPNMTATIGDTLQVGNISAPTMLSAELQVYIDENTPPGTYTGTLELINGTETITSSNLTFEVRTPKSKVLWEDYFNDYGYIDGHEYWGTDCERLWGGALGIMGGCIGVFEWWKLAANAGFQVDSLHQHLHFNEHVGFLGPNMKDPMQIIAYGGYDTMYMHDVDYPFSVTEISTFQNLYENGEMNFVVLFNYGSEAIDMFITNYGISYTSPYMAPDGYAYPMMDLLVTGVDKTHSIFQDVENFTLSLYPYEYCYFLRAGPFMFDDEFVRSEGEAKGIATGTDDFGLWDTSGFVVAVNELDATPHVTSRMIVVSGGNMFESLEYEDFLIWLNLYMINGNNTVVSKVDTDKFAVNMLEWVTPQFVNTAPTIDYATVTPNNIKPGEKANADLIICDPEEDKFDVTVAVHTPDGTWNNATASSVGGHWIREFTANSEGAHKVYAVAVDEYGASTTMHIGTVNVINNPPAITSILISPHEATQGDKIFITVGAGDIEDIKPAEINITITAPNGTAYNYKFTNARFANVIFDTKNMKEGIYNIYVTVKDNQGAETTANIGSFEVNSAPLSIPVKEIGLVVGIAGLIVLIAIAMLLRRGSLGLLPPPP
jgi:subtilisin family serine protease